MIRRLLFKKQNKTQLIIALLGAFIGFTFLIISVHYIIRVNEVGLGQEVFQNKAVIVQKRVSTLSSLNVVSTDFSEEEITELKQKEFIERVEPIKNNDFYVTLETDSDLLPYVKSDIFLQSVNKEFLGINSLRWNWKKGDDYVPVILPQDFLVMLNSFANAKGIPQISEDIAKSLGFKFKISNSKKRESFNVRIYGFTSEIPSILVPESFMDYANENYPMTNEQEVNQLILNIKKGRFGEFENYLEKNRLESKESSLMIEKLKSIANILFSILISIGSIIIFLSGLVIIQYAQLIISKNNYEIKTLLKLGYSPKTLVNSILRFFTKIFLLIVLVSFLSFYGLKFIIDKILIQNGIQIDTQLTLYSILVLILTFLIFNSFNFLSIKREIYRNN